MSGAIVDAVRRRPATRPWSVLVTRAVLVMLLGIVLFLNPVVALAISVASFALYNMLDANVLNRHRAGLRSEVAEKRDGGRLAQHSADSPRRAIPTKCGPADITSSEDSASELSRTGSVTIRHRDARPI